MLAMDLGFMGPNYPISTACATGNYCILRWEGSLFRPSGAGMGVGVGWRAVPDTGLSHLASLAL